MRRPRVATGRTATSVAAALALLAALVAAGCSGAPKPPVDPLKYRCHDARGRVMAMLSTADECKYAAGEWRLPAPASAPGR